MQQLSLPLSGNERLLLKNFIFNVTDDALQSVLKTTLQNVSLCCTLFEKQQKTNNIIYICGSTGVGKTHLLQASCYEALDSNLSVAYFDCAQETLTQDHTDYLAKQHWLSVDNVDTASFEVQKKLYSLYNQRQQTGMGLLISAKQLPIDLDLALVDLKTRLSIAPAFSIKSLDYEKKQIVLAKKMQEKGTPLSAEVYQYLLSRHSRNLLILIPTLEYITKVVINQNKKPQYVSVAFVKEILKFRTCLKY